MNNTFLLAALAAMLAACGSSSNTTSGATTPDGGASSFISGTVAGSSFAPQDATAVIVAPTTCGTGSQAASVAALAVGFSSLSGTCPFLQENGICSNRQNDTLVSLQIVREAVGSTATPIESGTYSITTDVPTSNPLLLTTAAINKTDASCNNASAGVTATGGSITLTTVASDRVAGDADVTFSDGSHVTGSFDVGVCNITDDFCGRLAGTCQATCMP